MKVLTAYVVSFCCFWLGHSFHRLMFQRGGWVVYPAYNRLMLWSSGIEEWAGIEFMWREPIKAGGTSSDD